ncbi:MAG: SRPBCC domain-containing protein [Thermoplasmata archaeon]
MVANRKGPTIEQTYFFRAPVAKVFRSLTEPSELTRWFLKSARLPHTAGATYEFVWQLGYRHRAKVIAFVPNRKLSLEWPAKGLGMTQVTFTFAARKGGTRVTLRHTGYGRTPAWVDNYGGTCEGWAYFLTNLKSVLRTGTDLREAGDA